MLAKYLLARASDRVHAERDSSLRSSQSLELDEQQAGVLARYRRS